ncbi:MAG: hypothetical protein JXR48_05290 [Candidatus Delongbacteria bacterium]|nr:hypothetical protein [Candidatus Delongbacteria bacterium]MBN2834363.1 hypothetical protein [Candidatus Delongbacteria bacterium]
MKFILLFIFSLLFFSCLNDGKPVITEKISIPKKLNLTSIKFYNDNLYLLDGISGTLFMYDVDSLYPIVKPSIAGRSFFQDFIIKDSTFIFANIYDEIFEVNVFGDLIDTLKVYKPLKIEIDGDDIAVKSFDGKIRILSDGKIIDRGKQIKNSTEKNIKNLAETFFNSGNRIYKMRPEITSVQSPVYIHFRDPIFKRGLDEIPFGVVSRNEKQINMIGNFGYNCYLLKFTYFKNGFYDLDRFFNLGDIYDSTVSVKNNDKYYVYSFVKSEIHTFEFK